MKAIHFICHHEGGSWRGLHTVDSKQGRYVSECWTIADDDPQQLVNGYIYFHESSSKRAEFVARIISLETCPLKHAADGIQFQLRRVRGQGQQWRGTKPTQSRPHGGIVDADLPAELVNADRS